MPLREKIADFYNLEGFKTLPENILITSGSQQALFIIAKYFEHKDIIIEKPSYLGAINTFKTNNSRASLNIFDHLFFLGTNFKTVAFIQYIFLPPGASSKTCPR